MKVLLATSAAVPNGGGVASYNQELVKTLSKKYSFHLLTLSDEHYVEGFVSTESIFRTNFYDYEVAKQLIEKINSEDYSLIINSGSEFISIVAPFLKTPIISIAHFVDGILADCAGYNGQYNNAIIVLSYYCKNYIEGKFKIDDNKVKVVYNFVHRKTFNLDKFNRKKLTIVFPGGVSIKKSFDVVMDVAYRLKKTNLDFSFYWLGDTKLPSSNYSLLGIKDIHQMLHDDSRFIITGKIPRDESENIIASANIFLLPSRGEGCPITLLEALRVGCIPIVSDAHHGSLELMVQSKAGLIVKQNDSKATFNLILDIIENHDKYKEYYAKSKVYSETMLNPEVWVSKMNSIIHEAMSSPKHEVKLTEILFSKSRKGYLRLKKRDRWKSIIKSAHNRAKMDWMYLRWKGWK